MAVPVCVLVGLMQCPLPAALIAELHQELEAVLLVVRQWPARWAAAQQRLQQLQQGGQDHHVAAGFWLLGQGGG